MVGAPTADWTTVLRSAEPDTRQTAWDKLCEIYRDPVHAFIGRQVVDPERTDDLTQAFFLRLLEKRDFSPRYSDQVHFQHYLMASVRHFLANYWRRERAKKRGGAQLPLSLESDAGRLRREAADPLTPEIVYERHWATLLVTLALRDLEREYAAAGKRHSYRALRDCLGDGIARPYRDLGSDMGKTEGAVKTAVHRMRRRFRELLRTEIARNVGDPDEVESELRFLLSVLRS